MLTSIWKRTEGIGPTGLGDCDEKMGGIRFSLSDPEAPSHPLILTPLSRPTHLTPTLPTHSSNPHTKLSPPTHPANPTPNQLTFRPWPDLAHLTPTHFSLSPYPTPPLSFPTLVSMANLLGFKNWFNQIHFQISLYIYINNITSCIWWSLHIRLCINYCFGKRDDGLQPPQLLLLPQLIVWFGLTSFSTWFGLTSFSTQKGHIRQHPNHVDTSLEKVTKSVYNGSNTYLKPYTEMEMPAGIIYQPKVEEELW